MSNFVGLFGDQRAAVTEGIGTIDGIARANEARQNVPASSPNQLRHSIGAELSQTLGQQAEQW